MSKHDQPPQEHSKANIAWGEVTHDTEFRKAIGDLAGKFGYTGDLSRSSGNTGEDYSFKVQFVTKEPKDGEVLEITFQKRPVVEEKK